MYNRKLREYKNKQVQEDLYQFEMGNELGAQIEKMKNIHEQEYHKTSIENHQDQLKEKKEK